MELTNQIAIFFVASIFIRIFIVAFFFPVYAIAVWRISSIFVNEGGPWDVFLKIRTNIAGIGYDEFGKMSIIPGNILAGILSCVWCCSVWVGFFFTLFWLIFPTISLIFAIPFALSALAIGYDKFVGGQ